MSFLSARSNREPFNHRPAFDRCDRLCGRDCGALVKKYRVYTHVTSWLPLGYPSRSHRLVEADDERSACLLAINEKWAPTSIVSEGDSHHIQYKHKRELRSLTLVAQAVEDDGVFRVGDVVVDGKDCVCFGLVTSVEDDAVTRLFFYGPSTWGYIVKAPRAWAEESWKRHLQEAIDTKARCELLIDAVKS